MGINVNFVISKAVAYISEIVTSENVKFEQSGQAADLIKLMDLLSDLVFQVDFSLMSSVTEVQELYDMYRNRLADESNIEIRTLLKLSSYIYTVVHDEYSEDQVNPWQEYIDRLGDLIALHSTVDPIHSCQDESILSGMSSTSWVQLLSNNPWLVAAVSIQYIPSYYLLDILVGIDAEIKPVSTTA